PKLPLTYRQRISIRPRVRRARIISGERDGIDHRNGFHARSGLKFGLQSFGKAPKRSGIGILRRRQSDASSPDTFRTKSHFLSAEPHETGNQHGGSGQKHDRQSDLRRDQTAAQPMLALADAGSASGIV